MLVLVALFGGGPSTTSLLNSIPKEAVGPVLSVVFVLGGAPIGFLISQPWYLLYREVWWTRQGVMFEYKQKHSLETEVALAKADQQIIRNDKLARYLNHRWDLVHLLGSEVLAIWLGDLIILLSIGWTSLGWGSLVSLTMFGSAILSLATAGGAYFAHKEHQANTRLALL